MAPRVQHESGAYEVEVLQAAARANDLIVARRQKRKGMGWSLETSDSLAALRALLLIGGWERYWVRGTSCP